MGAIAGHALQAHHQAICRGQRRKGQERHGKRRHGDVGDVPQAALARKATSLAEMADGNTQAAQAVQAAV